MTEHALELGGREHVHDPRGAADRGALLRAAHGERVGHFRVGHRDPRLGQVGLDAEALDHRVQARRLLRRDRLGAHRREPDLVRQEELRERQRADDDHHRHGARAGGQEHHDEGHVDESEQEHRQQHPGLETRVAIE